MIAHGLRLTVGILLSMEIKIQNLSACITVWRGHFAPTSLLLKEWIENHKICINLGYSYFSKPKFFCSKENARVLTTEFEQFRAHVKFSKYFSPLLR